MIMPNPDHDESGGPTFADCTLVRLAGASALRRAALLLERSQRSPEEDRALVAAAQAAVECAALASERDHPRCLVPDLLLVRALAATGDQEQAIQRGHRLWRRCHAFPAVQAELALDLAGLSVDPLARSQWQHLAAAAIGRCPDPRLRARLEARLAAGAEAR